MPDTEKVVQTFVVEQIFVELDSFYEENDSEHLGGPIKQHGAGEPVSPVPSKKQ